MYHKRQARLDLPFAFSVTLRAYFEIQPLEELPDVERELHFQLVSAENVDARYHAVHDHQSNPMDWLLFYKMVTQQPYALPTCVKLACFTG